MRTAYHEAGHAVAVRHLGFPIFCASLDGNGPSGRNAHVGHPPCGFFFGYVLVAGLVASLRARRRKTCVWEFGHAMDDHRKFMSLYMPWYDFDHIWAFWEKLEQDVAGFLYQPSIWEHVVGFADGLLRSSPLSSKTCMELTKNVPRASLVEIQHTMLNPVFHDHIGRRIGHARRSKAERLLRDTVERLRPGFDVAPPLAGAVRGLKREGYSADAAKALLKDMYGFWLRPTPSR